MNQEIKIFQTIEELNEFARGEIVRIAAEAIRERDVFTIALSGGSTPKKLYEMLAADDFKSEINWRKAQIFWGDERLVTPTNEESNYRMTNEALLKKIDIPAENVHRYLTDNVNLHSANDSDKTDNSKNAARRIAEEMETEIKKVFNLQNNKFPVFDLILLGMGADGHTASLFPYTEALQENSKIVTQNHVKKLKTFRLTFTATTINNARNVIFLIAGEDKASALREVLQGAPVPEKFPSQLIQPEKGKLKFLLEAKAASLLDN